MGRHQPAPLGSSLSGSNGLGDLPEVPAEVVIHTPAFGAHAMTRSPGPLPADTSKEVGELGPEAAYHPEMTDKTIAYSAAESSLMERLDHVRRLKDQTNASQDNSNYQWPENQQFRGGTKRTGDELDWSQESTKASRAASRGGRATVLGHACHQLPPPRHEAW